MRDKKTCESYAVRVSSIATGNAPQPTSKAKIYESAHMGNTMEAKDSGERMPRKHT